jgi:hypothetical protein
VLLTEIGEFLTERILAIFFGFAFSKKLKNEKENSLNFGVDNG